MYNLYVPEHYLVVLLKITNELTMYCLLLKYLLDAS